MAEEGDVVTQVEDRRLRLERLTLRPSPTTRQRSRGNDGRRMAMASSRRSTRLSSISRPTKITSEVTPVDGGRLNSSTTIPLPTTRILSAAFPVAAALRSFGRR